MKKDERENVMKVKNKERLHWMR